MGTVITVMGVTAPEGYLVCDGKVYDTADYPVLAEYFREQFGSSGHFGGNGTTTFAVPNLQGEFLRGAGANGHENQGSGSSVGVHQDATGIPSVQPWNNSNPGGSIAFEVRTTDENQWGNYVTNADSTSERNDKRYFYEAALSMKYASVIYRYSYTTRPTNTSVLFCIAASDL